MTSELRPMALYADGVQIADGARLHLQGRATMSCAADRWTLTLTGYDDADLAALRRASLVSVTAEEESTVAQGAVEDLVTQVQNGVETCTAVLADGAAFCQGHCSVAIRGGTTLEESLRTLLAHCDAPLPLVTPVHGESRFSRGQAFFGRTVHAVRALAKSAGYRAYVTHGGLYLAKRGLSPAVLRLGEEMLLDTPARLDGVTIVKTPVVGFQPGHCLILPGESNGATYRVIAQAIDADSYAGAWVCETVLLDEDAMAAGQKNDWEGDA